VRDRRVFPQGVFDVYTIEYFDAYCTALYQMQARVYSHLRIALLSTVVLCSAFAASSIEILSLLFGFHLYTRSTSEPSNFGILQLLSGLGFLSCIHCRRDLAEGGPFDQYKKGIYTT